jgi:hypothetical protein
MHTRRTALSGEARLHNSHSEERRLMDGRVTIRRLSAVADATCAFEADTHPTE